MTEVIRNGLIVAGLVLALAAFAIATWALLEVRAHREALRGRRRCSVCGALVSGQARAEEIS